MRVIANTGGEAIPFPASASGRQVVVVHRQPLVAEALASCLSTSEGLEVLAHGNNGAEAISLARMYQPQVILLDDSIDDAPAKVILASIALHSFHSKVVLLKASTEASSRWKSPLIVGEHLQDDGLESLVSLVQSAHSEHRTTDSTVTRESPSSQLISNRERSVLSLVASGKTNEQVARELYISASTVKRHLANIYAKLEVHSRVGAVMQAQRLGIVEIK